MKSKTLQNIKSILFALAIVLGTSYVSAAWTAPTLPPPGGNVSAPLNVGGNDVGVASYPQIKSGILTLMRLITPDLTVTKSDGTVTGIPAGSVLTAIGENTGRVGWVVPSCTPTYTVISTITNGTSWTAPSGVTSVKVEAWGGGGGGGGGMVDNTNSGGGGGSGGYSSSVFTVSPGTSYSVTVGAGGAGGAVGGGWHQGGAAGGNGSDTIFTLNGSMRVVAKGGGGGPGGPAPYGGTGGVVGTGSETLTGNDGPAAGYYQASAPGPLAPNTTSNVGKGGDGGISNGNTGNTSGGNGGGGGFVISRVVGCSTGGTTTTASGVSKIIAGTGVTVSPASGTGNVTINSSAIGNVCGAATQLPTPRGGTAQFETWGCVNNPRSPDGSPVVGMAGSNVTLYSDVTCSNGARKVSISLINNTFFCVNQ